MLDPQPNSNNPVASSALVAPHEEPHVALPPAAPSNDQSHDNDMASDPQNGSNTGYGGGANKVSPPITLLQEICSRNGFTAEYQLLSTEGSVHEPTFKIAVTVDDITVTASGQSKKKARHAAAREAIERLRKRPNLNLDGVNFENMAPLGCEPPAQGQAKESASLPTLAEANPVGKLQEICMKMRVNPPDYETCNERGLAHERIFMLSCSISSLNMTTLGEGRSKKLAKRQAAELMLAELENSEIYDKTANSKGAGELGASSINMDCDDNSHFVRMRGTSTDLCSRLDCNVNDLWADVKMIKTDDVQEDLFYELFQETLSKFGHCQFTFLTDSHCLLHVLDYSDNILMTSFGFGSNNIVAMKEAVLNAYRLMMCQMKPLTGKEDHLHHRAAAGTESLDQQMV